MKITKYKAAPQGNGLDAAPQGRCFELIPFDKIAFDTTPAYLVKGIVPRVGLCVFGGRLNAGSRSSFSTCLCMSRSAGNIGAAVYNKAPSSVAHSKGRPALEIALKRSGNASLPMVRIPCRST
jgi:hypothetical protein